MEKKVKESQKIDLKRKINLLKKITIKRIYLLYIISILIFYLPVISDDYLLFNMNFISEITLTIKGNGTQKILNNYYGTPLQVYLNDRIVYFTDNKYKTIYINGSNINNVRILWDNFNGDLTNSFKDLKNIIYVDLSKLNTPVINIANAFLSCTSLKSVNLSNLDTSSVTNMGHLFAECISLTSVDLSSFDTSRVKYMDNIFLNCFSLTSLNLSNFDTFSATIIEFMFKNCTSLTSLDLSSFRVKDSLDISNMFIGNINIEYLNIKNINIKEKDLQTFIRNGANNLVICINESVNINLSKYFNNCIAFDCSENWMRKRKKIYEGKCYDECPIGTFLNMNNTCENYSYTTEINKVYKESINLIIDDITTRISAIILNNSLVEFKICEAKEFFSGKCKNNFENKDDKGTFKENILSAIKDGSLINLISSQTQNNSHIIINEENEIYLISTLENQMNMENVTSINFSECEKLLREDPENNGEFYTFRIDHSIEGYNIPIIEYAIFNENGTIINLDKCNNIYSQYFIPVSIKNIFYSIINKSYIIK